MRPSEKLITLVAIAIFIVSGYFLYQASIRAYGTEIPVSGGRIQEGVIGYARFINPVLAISDADKDMSSLIYSGLFRAAPNGALIPDLAESWNISDDGLTYTFVLRSNLTFHDGAPITADDIEFTIQKALDPELKSPKASNFAGVMVQKINDREIKFILKKPYAPFAENLTLGILPKHIWSGIDAQAFDISTHNKVDPIGSGPYMVKKVSGTGNDLYDSFVLVPFPKYALGEPKISSIVMKFYRNQEDAVEAFESEEIDSLGGISPEIANALRGQDEDVTSLQTPLPRIFALFFNQNTAPILLRKEVRKALNMSIDRGAIIKDALDEYGSPIYSPIPSHVSLASAATSAANSSSASGVASSSAGLMAVDVSGAKILLEENGWKLAEDGVYERKAETAGSNPAPALRLAFTITTSNSPELKLAAEALKSQWKELGADVSIEIYEGSDLTQKIIKPRKYGALLFGQVVGRDLDLYPFWHSSQRNDPGLNIALYANAKADKAIELARSTNDNGKKMLALAELVQELNSDIPAIFLFSPNYTYLEHKKVKGQELQNINDPSERFMNVHEWYLDTKFKWNFLIREEKSE